MKIPAVVLAAVCAFHGPVVAKDPEPAQVIARMKQVADWQIANPTVYKPTEWLCAPFYLGLGELQRVSGDPVYGAALNRYGESCQWGPGPRVTHADDHAVLQAWLDVHQQDKDMAKLRPAIGHFPKIQQALAGKPKAAVAGGTLTWCWCDALYMSPPVWLQLANITGNAEYRDWAVREWWTTTDYLYDPQFGLYYRDNGFFKKRTPKGNKVFWARGNGWVAGGLTRVLDLLPEDHPDRSKFLGLYHDMMSALVKLQHKDGLWRSSLLDVDDPQGESSGSAFFVQAMAWGLNRGLLPADAYRPAVMRGWQALCGNIQPTGMLGFVQRVADAPGSAGAESTEIYGAGAFLQAGAEVVRMLDPAKRRTGLASFKGVSLPARYLAATPRVHARFVPERADDFAWENDLTAFRAYGPALRAGPENSGIDIWLKRVPWPIIDKWYLEDKLILPYGKVNKSYHDDHGEGYDAYKVGDSRGCGGISLWLDGAIHNTETFVAHRILANTPDRAVFELDHTSTAGAKIIRETKRITVVPGQRLFQCESRFTIDGKPGAFDVAIGLKPQVAGSQAEFNKTDGTLLLWETIDGLGLGTAVVVPPAALARQLVGKDGSGNDQALCLAKTDASGYIRWFAGYGWEGQGDITTAEAWRACLKKFARTFQAKGYPGIASPVVVHSAAPVADAPPPAPAGAATATADTTAGAPAGAVRLKANGGWCWFQDPRALATRGGKIIFTTIAGDTYGGADAGDLWATSWDPASGASSHFELADKFQRDDHDVAGLLERPDGRILAVYGKHASDNLQRWRCTTAPGDISAWTAENSLAAGQGYTYANVYQLAAENGRIYNFFRGDGRNPHCTVSTDNGDSWSPGWRLFQWSRDDLKDNPAFTGLDGLRPYVRYASDNKAAIHFITTEDHPRAYDNSIYHGFYRDGKLHDSTGNVLGSAGKADGTLKPTSFTRVFEGGRDRVAWTTDLELDASGHPFAVFSVQVDGAATRARGVPQGDCLDHRYYYARFDGTSWHASELAHAGGYLYPKECDYTGLVALDPLDPDVVVISTNADPVAGTPLLSKTDGKRHWELFRGRTTDRGRSWKWQAITSNSSVDNLRPIIPAASAGNRVILWCRGDLSSFTDYRLDVFALAESR